MRMIAGLVVGLVGSAALAGAQQGAAAGVSVSGLVVFADTNGPARFEKVLLKPVIPAGGDDDLFAALTHGEDGDKEGAKPKLSAEEQAQKQQQMAASRKMMAALSDLLQSSTVAADGTYTFVGVKPGTYYVHAMAKGYIDPLAQFSADELASTDTAVRKRIAAVATMVTVGANDGAHADLRLERGASISGRVLYDDGSPAVGWTVQTVHELAAGEANPFAAMGVDASDLDFAHMQQASVTDDTGAYRIAGLASGDYVVRARLATGALNGTGGGAVGNPMLKMMGLKLTVYGGNTVRRAQAQTVSVKAGEARRDYDLSMPLSTMHALAGTVRAKSDGHPVSGGMVALTGETPEGKDDPGMNLMTTVHADGSFRFDYVPGPAMYSLKVTGAVDSVAEGSRKVLGQTVAEQKVTKRYGAGAAEARLGDGDVTDVKIDVAEAK